MNHRLSPLQLLPPPIMASYSGASLRSSDGEILRKSGGSLPRKLPLFWYDPPWYQVTLEQADNLAVAVGDFDVAVTAMRSDLCGPNSDSIFHQGRTLSASETSDDAKIRRYPRIVPYRAERYGLMAADFDDAFLIDLRLTIPRDQNGRFAYCPEQIQRWEATPATAPLAGGGWVPAAGVPPDVDSISQLSRKIDQLRLLAPSAAIFISMGPYRMEGEIPQLVAANPDGLILRFDEVQLEGLELAALTRCARQQLDAHGRKRMPLWIVPGKVSADDAVKLIALGASAVAIDDWCNELILQTGRTGSGGSRYASSYTDSKHEYDTRWGDFVDQCIGDQLRRFVGLHHSLYRVNENELLGSYSATWAKTLGVQALR